MKTVWHQVHVSALAVVVLALSVYTTIGSSPSLGPEELVKLWERHIATEFQEKSADEAVATMVADPVVNHVPVMTGGVGKEPLRKFYAKHFIPKMPADVKLTPIDRSVGKDTVVDEFIFEFTHNVTMDWMLPGVKPTGKKVKVPFVVVVKFVGNKLKAERIYWDQASVLVQLGLLDPKGLPVVGVDQARKAADLSSVPSNALIPKDSKPTPTSG